VRRRLRPGEKPLHWAGSSKRDLLTFPERVVDEMGYSLNAVQFGDRPPSAKPWKGFGPGVWELREYDASGTKSPSGVRTAQQDVARIAARLKMAKEDYEARYGTEEN